MRAPDHALARVEANRQGGIEGLATVDKNCGAGVSGVTIDPYGNVLPCVQWRRPLGNLHIQPIREIWSESAALAEVRRLNTAAKQMVDGHGPRGHLMAFCPGLAEALGGNSGQMYKAAVEQMELLDSEDASHALGEEPSCAGKPGASA
jgi:hypothetical protein